VLIADRLPIAERRQSAFRNPHVTIGILQSALDDQHSALDNPQSALAGVTAGPSES
jgi:hypothetical protein